MTKKADDQTPATDTDAAPDKPQAAAPAQPMPNEGGSYIRQADGSLVKQEG